LTPKRSILRCEMLVDWNRPVPSRHAGWCERGGGASLPPISIFPFAPKAATLQSREALSGIRAKSAICPAGAELDETPLAGLSPGLFGFCARSGLNVRHREAQRADEKTGTAWKRSLPAGRDRFHPVRDSFPRMAVSASHKHCLLYFERFREDARLPGNRLFSDIPAMSSPRSRSCARQRCPGPWLARR